MKESLRKAVLTAFILFTFYPNSVYAGLIISEIMYDASSSDTDKEWVEIQNTGDEIDITGYKFFDGANHILNIPPKNDGRGDMLVPSGGFTIFSVSPDVFISEFSSYDGSVVDTSMSLGNTSAVLKILDKEGVEVASASYNKEMGANGDGDSLHFDGSKYVSAPPSVGRGFSGNPSDNTNNNTSSSNTTTTTTSSTTNTYKELLEIYADAGSDRVVMAGAEAIFAGKGYGTDKALLSKARYSWNFGDGSTNDGQTVSHSFVYPGDYAVILYVSSGEYTANDKVVVKAIPSPISISAVNYFGDPYIKIKNSSLNDLDLSLWHIRAGDKFWSFPTGTFILKQNEIILSYKKTGVLPKIDEEVALLYPNGERAFIWGAGNEQTEKIAPKSQPVGFIEQPINKAYPLVPSKLGEENVSSGAGLTGSSFEQEVSTSTLYSSSVSSGGSSLIKWFIILLGVSGLLVTILFTFYKNPEEKNISETKILGAESMEKEIYKEGDGYIPEAEEFEIMEDIL